MWCQNRRCAVLIQLVWILVHRRAGDQFVLVFLFNQFVMFSITSMQRATPASFLHEDCYAPFAVVVAAVASAAADSNGGLLFDA